MSLSSKSLDKERYNKKLQDIVNRFEYYSSNVLESFEVGKGSNNIQDISHTSADIGFNSYHLLRHKREPFSNQTILSKSLLSTTARESLVPKDAQIHHSLLTKGQFKSEVKVEDGRVVDIWVIENTQKNEEKPGKIKMKMSQGYNMSSSLIKKSQVSSKNFNVYIIHFPVQNHTVWSYYVEKITLRENCFDSEDLSRPIEYQALVAFPKQGWFQKNITKFFADSPQMVQLATLVKEIKERLNLFQSTLAKNLVSMTNEESEGQEGLKDCHPQFKRESKLPTHQYKKFVRLRKQTYTYFTLINSERKLNPFFLDNLICRYMLVKKYNEEESLKALKKYLDWEKDMRSRYSMEQFQKYVDLQIFKYIGKDFDGRPVIFFQAKKFLPGQLKDIAEYFDYNAYLLEIFNQDQMEGYIDEYIIIGDYTDFGKANFQYGPAKQFSDTGSQYFPQRQYKLILFGVGTFGEWIYKILKPVLPEFLIRKISIYGSDRDQLKKSLEQVIDIQQIPSYVFEEAPTDAGLTPKKNKNNAQQ